MFYGHLSIHKGRQTQKPYAEWEEIHCYHTCANELREARGADPQPLYRVFYFSHAD